MEEKIILRKWRKTKNKYFYQSGTLALPIAIGMVQNKKIFFGTLAQLVQSTTLTE